MGLFDNLVKAVGEIMKTPAQKDEVDYDALFERYSNADFTYDTTEYPNKTELIKEYTNDLAYAVEHNPAAAEDLAVAFLLRTVRSISMDILHECYNNKLAEKLLQIEPWTLAAEINGQGTIIKTLLTSDGFKQWGKDLTDLPEDILKDIFHCTSMEQFKTEWGFTDDMRKPSAEDCDKLFVIALRNCKTMRDEDYLNWEDAKIWERWFYRVIDTDLLEEAVQEEMKEFYAGKNQDDNKGNEDSYDDAEPIDLDSFEINDSEDKETIMNNHDIAIAIEKIMCREFGFSGRPRGTIFDADYIEMRSFYDCVSLILHKRGKGDWSGFLDSIYEYAGKNISMIPNLIEVYSTFRNFVD